MQLAWTWLDMIYKGTHWLNSMPMSGWPNQFASYAGLFLYKIWGKKILYSYDYFHWCQSRHFANQILLYNDFFNDINISHGPHIWKNRHWFDIGIYQLLCSCWKYISYDRSMVVLPSLANSTPFCHINLRYVFCRTKMGVWRISVKYSLSKLLTRTKTENVYIFLQIITALSNMGFIISSSMI